MQSPSPPARRKLFWGKWPLFVAYWAIQLPLGFFGWAFTVGGDWRDAIRDSDYQLWFAAIAGCLMVCQAAFLSSVRAPSPGRDFWWSRTVRCLLAGAAIGLMIAALAFTALLASGERFGLLPGAHDLEPHLFWWIALPVAVIAAAFFFLLSGDRPSARLSLTIAGFGAAALSVGIPWVALSVTGTLLNASPLEEAFGTAILGTLALNWVIATPLLIRFLRRAPVDDVLGRVAAWLFLGSVVEAAAVIPIDVMVRRKSTCYCGEGTLWTLTICWGVGALALGPAVWLIPLVKRRKRWLMGHCEACGYDMTACPAVPRCPECGSGWRAG
jgi:hypothetical protein